MLAEVVSLSVPSRAALEVSSEIPSSNAAVLFTTNDAIVLSESCKFLHKEMVTT